MPSRNPIEITSMQILQIRKKLILQLYMGHTSERNSPTLGDIQ